MNYEFDDQCFDFFKAVCPALANGTGDMKSRIKFFEEQFRQDRERLLRNEAPKLIPTENLYDIDIYFSRQPSRVGSLPAIIVQS